MIDLIFFTSSFGLIAASLAIQIVYLIRSSKKPDPFSTIILSLSFLAILLGLIIRSIKIGFVAVTNTFEGLVVFAGFILLALVMYRLKARKGVLAPVMLIGTALSFTLLALASSPLIPAEANPPIPALRSYWLVLHVLFAFAGEGFFTVSFAASLYYLATREEQKKAEADRIIYTTVLAGYLLFTLGALIFGAIWAKYAWGAYWSWDPKETWALITWLTYTAYLHFRLIRKVKGKVSAIICIIGFIFTVFTFLGVNYLLPGLHSYS